MQGEGTDGVEVDIDFRLQQLWLLMMTHKELLTFDDHQREYFSVALRLAYEKGYQDALREVKQGRAAALYIANGYELPEGV